MQYICLTSFLLLALSFLIARGDCAQHVLLQQGRLRNATAEDIADIAFVINSAFDALADRQYLYQFRNEYPKEHARCTRQDVRAAMAAGYMRTEVIEAPDNSELSVMAVAVWSRKHPTDGRFPSIFSTKCTHRDLNMTRALDWDHKFTAAKSKNVNDYFGKDQLYLELLATHPDYQGHGAGTRLVRNGLRRAQEADINATLIAEATAETFYMYLGFASITNIGVETVDGDLTFRFDVMAYAPK